MVDTIRFFFDFISPYAYLAYPEVRAVASRTGARLELRPTLFAALLDAHGNKGPAEIPAKREYVFKHVSRLAHAAGRPLQPPPAHPFNPLLALRLAGLPMPDPEREALVERLYDMTWGGGSGVTEPADLVDAANALGLDGAALVEAAASPAAKATLRATTQAAVDRGVFGVPTMLYGDELFWGLDAVPHLERFIRGEDPLDADALGRWRDLPAGAVRPGSRR